MSRTAPLYALQQTDSEIDARQQRLSEIVEQLGETEKLIAARQELTAAQAELAQWQSQQRSQDLILQDLQQKIRNSNHKLYGGKIRNPKELSDLQEEVASLNRRKETIEDELLEIMLEIEASEAKEQQATETLARVDGEWRGSQANLQAEKESQETRLAELIAQRQSQIANIPPADLKSYEYLRQRKGGQAVALLKGSECQGCMASLPSTTVKEARGGAITNCGTCGRIMHVG